MVRASDPISLSIDPTALAFAILARVSCGFTVTIRNSKFRTFRPMAPRYASQSRSAPSDPRSNRLQRSLPMPDAGITALIVDDEPLGRDLVRHMLSPHSDVRLLAECSDGETALGAIKRHAPRL